MKKLIILFVALTLTSCASVKEKMPKFEQKACDGSRDTLADVFCKKAD